MKKSEFKTLIREEIRKVLKEATPKKYSFEELQDFATYYLVRNFDSTKARMAMRTLYDVGFLDSSKANQMTYLDHDRIDSSSYKTTDGKNLKQLRSWLLKMQRARQQQADRRFSAKVATPTSQKPTKIPVSGKKYTDDALLKGGFIVKDHVEDWLNMFGSDSYSPSGDDFVPNDAVIDANDWLKINKYPFRMKNAFSDDDGATITWTIK